MKKGPAIIVILGIALFAFLYFSPVVPPAKTEVTEVETESNQSKPTPDEIVDQALEELGSGTTPPMEAIMKIRQVAEDYPNNIKANYTLGLLSMRTGQYDKAVGRFNKVIENDPEDVDAYLFLAESLLNVGDTNSALDTYKRSLPLASDTLKGEIEKEIKNLSIN